MQATIMNFDLDVSLGESYIHGSARLAKAIYAINIQNGVTGIALPRDLGAVGDKVEITLFTANGQQVSLVAILEEGDDMIEIFDDSATSKLAKDLPVRMTLRGL